MFITCLCVTVYDTLQLSEIYTQFVQCESIKIVVVNMTLHEELANVNMTNCTIELIWLTSSS